MAGMRVLLVESNTSRNAPLRSLLEKLGHQVIAVADRSEEAVELAGRLQPELVLMDAGETARRLRDTLHLPVIVLTDETTSDEPLDCLTRPVQERDLKAALAVARLRHDAERRLRDCEERHRATLHGIGEGIVAVDAQNRVTLVNAAAERLTGWIADQACGRPLQEVLSLSPEPTAATESRSRPALLTRRDGRTVPVEVLVVPLRDSPERPPSGAVIACRDVSEQRAMEEQLRQMQKMESLGAMAGGIAHDFNNLLTPILGYATLLPTLLPPGSPAREPLRQLEQAARRAAELAHQMLAYAGRAVFTPCRLDLCALVREAVPLAGSALPPQANVQLDLETGPLLVEADRAQLRQVVVNLLGNAGEALQGRAGTIRIQTRLIQARAEEVSSAYVPEPLPAGPYVALEVSDTGCGMSEEVKARLFDPFFTTKFLGRGLGLSAVLGTVRTHRGGIRVESQPGHGSRFLILLPAAPPASTVESGTRPRRVLVIEEDEGVRHLVERILRGEGYAVETAAEGGEGLAEIVAAIGAVVLDVSLPAGEGGVLVRLRALRPDLPVVLMSSYGENEVRGALGDPPQVSFLAKPFRPAALLSALAQMLPSR